MSKAKVTSLEDWGIGGDEDKEDEKENIKNLSKIKEDDEITTSSKKTKKTKDESESVSSKKKQNKKKDKDKDKEDKEKSTSKKKTKLKGKEREKDELLDEDEDEEKTTKKNKKNNVYKELYKHLKNLQPDASKSIKKKTYEYIKKFVEENDLDDECYDLLIKGEDKDDILGICELISKKTRTGSFKGSTHELLKIIHYWFHDIDDDKKKKMIENFSLNEEYVKNMKLGEHYSRLYNSTKKEEKKLSHQIIHIIKEILDARKTLELKDLIKSGFNDCVSKGLEKYRAAIKKKMDQEKKEQEEENKEINENVEKEEHIKNMDEDYNPISLEPRTWEAAEKLNKRILTCDFLASNRGVDEAADVDLEFIENFIDPLDNNKKLNIGDYTEEDIKKMHIQMDTFEPIFFLQKIYKKISLKEFANSIIEIDNNLKKINEKDEKLIDKNIYKYLDCKKLLDTMLTKFNDNSTTLMSSFNTQASSLQNSINSQLTNIKKSFDQIIKAKMCKEILNKLSKYFQLKDKIEENLKFSNIDELADILKRVNVELNNISQNRLIYGEFFIYFSQKIDDFKNRLIDIIKNAPVTENVLKYFKYLFEFQLETETVEQLLNLEKVKMCDKIKVYLENTENFEINNYREFFCDEYPLQNINDEVFIHFIREAEMKINEDNNKKEKKKKIYDYKRNDNTEKKIKKIKDKEIMEEIDDEKKELINVETIVKSILDDINEFLFTMKVLDEMISMKNIYERRNIQFHSIATEIYFVLFEKLETFLFDKNSFDMLNLINEHYTSLYNKLPQSNYITKIQQFYDKDKEIKNIIFNNKFNKNNLNNLSNLVVEIFEKFEYHLSKEIIGTLNENKSLFIKKIFYAYINEQINSNLAFFINENTITYTDTQITIFNQSSFNFTKSFLQQFTQSYIGIIKFYMNIVTKINNISLEYDLIYDSFFFILKCFVFRFLIFYRIEKRYQADILNLNCLVIESYRNVNYIQFILSTLLKRLFKNKEKDYINYQKDFNEFIKFCKNLYLKQYTVNSANNLLSIFINNSAYIIDSQNNNNNENNNNNKNNNVMPTNKFYEKYNEILVGKNNNSCFTDLRSCFIDLLNGFSNCIRDLNTIFEEERSDNKSKKIIKTLQYIINFFYDRFILNSSSTSANSRIFLGQEESQKNIDIFKFNAQLLLEMQLLTQILKKFSSEQLREKANIVYSVILGYLGKIKGLPQGNIRERDVFDENELQMKNNLINLFLPNYESFYKIFN